MKAPAPSLSLWGGLIYSTSCVQFATSTSVMSAIENAISWLSSSTSQSHVSTVFHSTCPLQNGTSPISDHRFEATCERWNPQHSPLRPRIMRMSDSVEIIQCQILSKSYIRFRRNHTSLATIFTKTEQFVVFFQIPSKSYISSRHFHQNRTVCGLFSPLPARLLCLICSNDRTTASVCSLPDVIWTAAYLRQALTA
jgi:hypothetical protein